MQFLPESIYNYIIGHSEKEPELLQELSRETWQKVLNPRMLSGALQGRFLTMISKLIQPKKILEIGTYTGYATLCLAEGLTPQGELYTIDNNEELTTFSQKYFQKSKYHNQIKPCLGNAIDVIPKIKMPLDLVFIDADKQNYSNYFYSVIEKMSKGGVIISDNVLWSGKVVEKLDPKDADTKALLAYNTLLNNDPRITTVILPIRDGLTISRVE